MRKLRKSATDKALAGVCGGIAEYLNIGSFWVRLIFVFMPFGIGIIVYAILANVLKDSPPTL